MSLRSCLGAAELFLVASERCRGERAGFQGAQSPCSTTHDIYSQFLDDGESAAATKLLDHGDMDVKSAIMPVNAVADARKDIPRDGAGLIR